MINDAKERELALDINQSFIVEAPAGSGKTTILIKRFLTLLGRANNPEEIIAITFTRKAATEMKNRIIEELKLANNPLAQRVIAKATEKNWDLLNNPNQLRIQTIDALCSSLSKQMPLSTNFSAHADIVQGQEAISCYQHAAQSLLADLETNAPYANALEQLLLHLDNDYARTSKLFVEMLMHRDQWLWHIVNPKDRDYFETGLKHVIDDHLRKCLALYPRSLENEICACASFAAYNLIEVGVSSTINKCKASTTLNNHKLEFWQAIAELLLTKDNTWRKQINKNLGFPAEHKDMKQRFSKLLEQLAAHTAFKQALIDLKLSPAERYEDSQWAIVNALLQLLPVLAAHLKLVFQQQGVTDFAEIAMAALNALSEDDPSELMLRLDYQIKHILVDEFQDTSNTQFRLLERLTLGWQQGDGRSLFLVGDPKQSIYRFREAEVGLFLRAKQYGINDIKLAPLTLTTNFRSTSTIVDWINTKFQTLMPASADIATGAIPYSCAYANQSKNGSEILYRHESSIINIIKSLQSINNTVILIRSRAHLLNIIPVLKDANIPFSSTEIEPLNNNVVVLDLFSLTRAIINLEDRIAWLSILRAPWCGLSLSALEVIANGGEIIWETINHYQTLALELDARSRLERLVLLFRKTLALKTRLTLRSLVEQTWLLLGGPACLTTNTELDNAELFFQLLEQIDDDLDLLTNKLTELYAKHNSNSGVQIMTIHKSKGLEFDNVIIPGLERGTKNNISPLLLWMERQREHSSDLLLAPIKHVSVKTDGIYDYLLREHKIKDYYETGRLLYVGVTRAKKNLYLLANDTKAAPGSFLEQLNIDIPENTSVATYINKEKLLQRLQPSWQLPKIAYKFPELRPSLEPTSITIPDQSLSHIGAIIHKSLELLSKEPKTDLLAFWHKELRQVGLMEYLETIKTAINNTLNDERGCWILAPHKEAQSEYAISAIIDNELKHFVIDRTFVDNDIRWIIDYKTTLNPNYEDYKAQLAQYARAFQFLDDREIRLGVYFPLLQHWYEEKCLKILAEN